jgi:hypothetical protein
MAVEVGAKKSRMKFLSLGYRTCFFTYQQSSSVDLQQSDVKGVVSFENYSTERHSYRIGGSFT